MELNEIVEIRNNNLEEGLKYLQKFVVENPHNALANYELGSSLDMSDRSEEAVQYYTKAIEIGLDNETEQECILGLGSSLSWKNMHKESLEVLKNGVEKYPENMSLRLFYGISLYRSQDFQESAKTFLELLATCKDSEVSKFRRAINNYLEEM